MFWCSILHAIIITILEVEADDHLIPVSILKAVFSHCDEATTLCSTIHW